MYTYTELIFKSPLHVSISPSIQKSHTNIDVTDRSSEPSNPLTLAQLCMYLCHILSPSMGKVKPHDSQTHDGGRTINDQTL